MFHIYGMTAVTLTPLAFGATILTVPKFEPVAFLDVIVTRKVRASLGLIGLVTVLTLHFLPGDDSVPRAPTHPLPGWQFGCQAKVP